MYQIGHAVGCLAWAPIYSWDILPNTHRSIETWDPRKRLLSQICPTLLCAVTQQVNGSFGNWRPEARDCCGPEQWPEGVNGGDVTSQPCRQDRPCPVFHGTRRGLTWLRIRTSIHVEKEPERTKTLFSPISKFFFSSIDCGSPDLRLSAGSGRSALLKSGKS